MKGYKGFEKGLICKGKQYAENTVFEEDTAKICESGMHFCKNPFDVWRFYPPCNDQGELNEFAEVEALDDTETEDGMKFCTTKLRIGAKLKLSDFIQVCVKATLENAQSNTGDRSAATNTGNCSAATNTGDCSVSTNTGDYSAATNTGYCSAATNTGYRSAATNTGDYSAATNTGNCSAATNTGDCSAATVSGKGSIAIVTGYGSKAKGSKGSWIVCTERDAECNILCVKAAEVDGENIKEDTFYTLKDGKFIESEDTNNEKETQKA